MFFNYIWILIQIQTQRMSACSFKSFRLSKKAELVSRNGVKFSGDSDYAVMGYLISFYCRTNSS